MSPSRRAFVLPALGWCLWLSSVVLGSSVLWKHQAGPGEPARAPVTWPEGSGLTLAADRPTLVMLAHPHCPCTRASIEELNRLMAQCAVRPEVFVLVYTPANAEPGWEHTDLWDSAQRIPGVHVLRDEDARMARLLGGKTSGQVLLYTHAGELAFSGGITSARGHAGDNAGRAAVVSICAGNTPEQSTTPVFGCSLLGPEEGGDAPRIDR